MKLTTLAISAAAILALLLTGCDQAEIILEPEKAEKSKLLNKLKQYQAENPQEYDQLTIELNNEQKIVIHGDSQQVNKITSRAHHLDQPATYYLEISNTNHKQYSTNNRDQTLQVLLNPGHKVTITQHEWQSTPWRHYQGIESNKVLELELNEYLQLAINIRSNQNNNTRTLSGQYQLQENKWVKLMGNQRVTQNTIISTRDKKQLWLRLHPVEIEIDNQNP